MADAVSITLLMVNVMFFLSRHWCHVIGAMSCDAGGVVDTYASFVWEPALVKINALTAATEAACLVLSVDETVRNPKSEGPDGQGGPGRGMPGRGRGRGRGRGMRR